MYEKRNSQKFYIGKKKGDQRLIKIDEGMNHLLYLIKITKRYESLGCCNGHFRYPITIIVRDKWSGKILEFVSGMVIPRKRRFYKRDKNGYYYIPEVSNEKT